MTHDELQWMHLKDQYSELARAAGSPSDARGLAIRWKATSRFWNASKP